jgi:CDP-diacylglycerol--serine O-phosphatidyltransferase
MDEPNRKITAVRHRGIYLLPNLMTTGALFAGFYGIVAAIDGNYERAAVALFIAQILDGLDGRLARLTGTESEFGRQYDSLSDLVAFGVAPAIIMYQWGLVNLREFGWIWGKLGWLAAFLYAVSAALRLARFNVRSASSESSSDSRFFEGLPSPPAAIVLASLVWLGTELEWSGGFPLALATIATAVTGGLMVSRMPYYSFKEVSAKGRISFASAVGIPLTFVLIALDPPRVLFILSGTYALSGPALALWRWCRKRAGREGKRSGNISGT